MEIRKLKVCAFRGVPGELCVDLTSPVTLLYAPNGTGKTSICDALEWLLTGRVGRMGHSLGDAGKSLRCHFSDRRKATAVEAEISKGGAQPKLLRRQLSDKGPELQYQLAEQEWRTYKNLDFLKWCAPLAPRHAVSGTIPAEDARRWLRATYFFEGPSSGLLIDSSEDADKTRLLLFARLLGIGEIESRDQAFGRLIAQVRPEFNRLQREINALGSERARRRKEAKAVYPPAKLKKQAEERLRTVREVLRAYFLDPPDAIPSLKVKLGTAKRELEKKQDAVRVLRARLSSWRSLETRIDESRQRIAKSEARLEARREKLVALEKALGDATATQLKHRLRLSTTEELAAEVVQLSGLFEQALAEWERIWPGDALSHEVRLADLTSEAQRLQRDLRGNPKPARTTTPLPRTAPRLAANLWRRTSACRTDW